MKNINSSALLIKRVKIILSKINIFEEFHLEKLSGGNNNQIYKLFTADKIFCLKLYFYSTEDPRDRGKTEFGFLTMIWNAGIRLVPRPEYYDEKNHIGLYEFIDGRKITTEELDSRIVLQAFDFFKKINNIKNSHLYTPISKASESCFSIAEHISKVDIRVTDLMKMTRSTTINNKAYIFVQNKLLPKWNNIKEWILEIADQHYICLDSELPDNNKCLSPSDFGFHNTIMRQNHKLIFIDFEYAGWDDPAKMVGDFFCQPAVPVGWQFFPEFAYAVACEFPNPENELIRYKMLLPLYQIKWCCIMLNEFLEVGEKRRYFAQKASNPNEEKKKQLIKAESALKRVDFMKTFFTEDIYI